MYCLMFISTAAPEGFDIQVERWVHEIGYTPIYRGPCKLSVNNCNCDRVLILYDLSPMVGHEGIENARHYSFNLFTERLDGDIGHITVTPTEEVALHVLGTRFTGLVAELTAKVDAIKAGYTSKYPVIRALSDENSYRRRAKVELIEYSGGGAVQKTWKPGYGRMVDREIFAYSELSERHNFIGPLLEYGDNYIILPYHENLLTTPEMRRTILSSMPETLAGVLKALWQEGLFCGDMNPLQFLYTKDHGLQLVDFEFLQSYDERPKTLHESWDIVGWPEDFTGDKPVYCGGNLIDLHKQLWIEYTGHSLGQLADIAMGGKPAFDVESNRSIEMVRHLIQGCHEYQPLYTLPEYKGMLPCITKRAVKPRWEIIREHLPTDPGVFVDLGSQHGYYVYRAAELGWTAKGVEADHRSHAIAVYLAGLNKPGEIMFQNMVISPDNANDIPEADVMCCLSIFHWWLAQYGMNGALKIMQEVRKKSPVLIFETGQSGEGFHDKTVEVMGDDPKGWIDMFLTGLGYSVRCIGEDWPTHFKAKRPRYVFLAEA